MTSYDYEAVVESIVDIQLEHDHTRMVCMDHDGKCCPAGDSHDMTGYGARRHQAECILEKIPSLLQDVIKNARAATTYYMAHAERMEAVLRTVKLIVLDYDEELAKRLDHILEDF